MSQPTTHHWFDQHERRVPANLRAPIEHWQHHVPSTQFQQYGPIDRYLNLKFVRDDHMVKPQAIFRKTLEEWEAAQREAASYDEDDQYFFNPWEYRRDCATIDLFLTSDIEEDDAVDAHVHVENLATSSSSTLEASYRGFTRLEDDDEEGSEDEDDEDEDDEDEDDEDADPTYVEEDVLMDSPDVSFDSTSRNPVISSKEGTKYPDFVVCSFYRPLTDEKDKVRVVIELASAGKDEKETQQMKKRVLQQLLRYMVRLGEEGDRWKGSVMGIAVIGTEVAFYDPVDGDGGVSWRHSVWYSLYGDEFLYRINEAVTWTAR